MIYDKIIYNALWCLASLDAIGNPFEFKTSINKSVLLDYAYDEYAEYKISDDTQMTLFGFIAAQNILREDYFTLENFSIEFKNQYLAWYHTQQEEKSSYFNSLLSKFSSLFSVQAPGLTCLYSLKQIKNGHTVNNDSKGCGSVMRLLPMLLFYKNENHNFTKEMIVYLAQQTGKITHLHPENDIAIKLYMETAMDILDGKEITSKYSHLDNISLIGSGWTCLEAVEMAIWSFTKSQDFDELIVQSIGHDGDSDSVGAIAGSFWGLSGKYWDNGCIYQLDAFDAIDYVVNRK